MARPGDCILVYMLEPQAVGSYFDRKRWPLHITLLPWFSAPPDRHEQLRQQLTVLARETAPVPVTVGEIIQLGANHTVQANDITDQTGVHALHQALLDLARIMQLPLVHTLHTGPAFMAHITRYGDRAVNAGEPCLVDNLYLIELQHDGTCQIVSRYSLAGAHA